MPVKKFNREKFEKDMRKEVGAYLRAANELKKAAILKTLYYLGTKLTEDGSIIGDTSEIGSPFWSGNFMYNHRIMVNGIVEAPEIEPLATPDYPMEISPEELVEREGVKLARTKFADNVSIVNDTPWADDIERRGTKLIPEGNFYGRAGQVLASELRAIGSSIVSVQPRDGDENW